MGGGDFVQRFIAGQRQLSRRFDAMLPERYRVDGATDFRERFLPAYLRTGARIYDIGGGKLPCLSAAEKARLDATVIGLDIDADELRRAPRGTYDLAVCADIGCYLGAQDGHLGVCRALLEHVRDTDAALRCMATCLRPGGRLVVFAPSRNALFARLNLLLPPRLRQPLLDLYASGRQRDLRGFPAYYDRCTPRDLEATARQHGLALEAARYYYTSGYFSVLFPVHFLWRVWLVLFRRLAGRQAAETFAMTFRKVEPSG